MKGSIDSLTALTNVKVRRMIMILDLETAAAAALSPESTLPTCTGVCHSSWSACRLSFAVNKTEISKSVPELHLN